MLIAAQLVAQRRGQAGRGQLLPLTAGLARTAAIDLYLGAALVRLAADKFHVLAHIQHRLAPALVLRLLAGKALHQTAQSQKTRLRHLAVLAPGAAQSLLDLLLELAHFRQLAVAGIDLQIGVLLGAAVERRLGEALVDQFHALQNLLARIAQIGRQRGQILLALALQQFEKALLVSRQTVALQARQLGEKIGRGGQTRIEALGFGGPFGHKLIELLFDQAIALAHLPGQGLHLVAYRSVHRTDELLEIFQAHRLRERIESPVQSLLLTRCQRNKGWILLKVL